MSKVKCPCGEIVSLQHAKGKCPACNRVLKHKKRSTAPRGSIKTAEALDQDPATRTSESIPAAQSIPAAMSVPETPSVDGDTASSFPLPAVSVSDSKTSARLRPKPNAFPVALLGVGVAGGLLVLALIGVGLATVLHPASERDVATNDDPPPAISVANTKRDKQPDANTNPSQTPRPTDVDSDVSPNSDERGGLNLTDEPEPIAEPKPVAETEPTTIYGGYRVRLPVRFKPSGLEKFGNAERWLIRQTWSTTTNPPTTLRVAIEFSDEYKDGRLPRLSTRVPTEVSSAMPILEIDGIHILPGGFANEETIAGLSFVAASTDAASAPISHANAVLYAAYDENVMIRIDGWYEGVHQESQHEELIAFARSLERPENPDPLPPPADLVVNEEILPTEFPVTTLANIEPVAGPTVEKETGVPRGNIITLGVSDGAKFIAFGGKDGWMRVYDRATKKQVYEHWFRSGEVDQLVFFGNTVLKGSSYKLRAAHVANLVGTVPVNSDMYAVASCNSDQTVSATAAGPNIVSGGTILARKLLTQRLFYGKGGSISSLEMSDDASCVAFGNEKGGTGVWFFEKDDFVATDAHQGPVLFSILTPDHSSLISYGKGQNLKIWSTTQQKVIHTKPEFGDVRGMLALDDDHFVMLHDGVLEKWSISKFEKVSEYTSPWEISAVGFSRDRRFGIVGKANAETMEDVELIELAK